LIIFKTFCDSLTDSGERILSSSESWR